jgi:leader peptidase (prepilin peptidase)/N-methyltransferase
MSPLLIVGVAFALGLLFGSFLNVCIARLPFHESIVKPASHCPACLFPIRWYDNIPVLSFLTLRARCRKCFQPISWQYPLVELATGLWFALCGWCAVVILRLSPAVFEATTYYSQTREDMIFRLATLLILGFLLIGLLVMDWQTHILPDAFTLPGIGLGFLLICTQAIFLPAGFGDIHLHKSMRMSSPGSMVEKGDVFLTGPEALVFGRLAAIVGAFLLIYLIRAAYRAVKNKEGLGLGDAKLLALIAALLGWWPAMLALFLGVILCSFYAVTLLARGRATAASRLPLGTFLCLGGLASALFSQPLLAWYSNLL